MSPLLCGVSAPPALGAALEEAAGRGEGDVGGHDPPAAAGVGEGAGDEAEVVAGERDIGGLNGGRRTFQSHGDADRGGR